MAYTDRNLSNLTISESFWRLMQTDPVDDVTLLDGTGSLVTYLAVSGTIDAYYLKGDGSQLTNLPVSISSGTVSSSAQTIANLSGTNIVSGSGQRSVLGLGTSDSPTFGGLTVTGTLTAKEFHTQLVSASIIFQSGSTKFGDTLDDTHQFTGSVLVSGSVNATAFVGDGSGLTGIVNALPNGLISGSQQISNFGFVSSSEWNDILNKPSGLVSSSAQTISNLNGTNIVSGSDQRSVLGLGENDSPRFGNIYSTNGNFDGNVVIGGTLTAQTYVVSSSIVNIQTVDISGSTVFGDTPNDTHRFTGSLLINGAATSSLGFYGDLTGTASNASQANTSSYIDPLFISASVAYYGFAGSSDIQWDNILFKPANIISGSGQRSILGLGENDSPRFGNIYSTNGNFDGNVVVGGTLTARTYVVSSSVVDYQTIQVSGSSKFGDTLDDTHQFTGSLLVTGSVTSNFFNGDGRNLTNVTASFPSVNIGEIALPTSQTKFFINDDPSGSVSGNKNISWQSMLQDIAGTGLVVTDFYDSIRVDPNLSGLDSVTATSFTGSLVGTASFSLTASYALNAAGFESGSFATTASNIFFGNQTINGDLIITGSLTAQQYIVSSSVLYVTQSFSSGSTMFGDSLDDTHKFTGSLYITGALIIPKVETLNPSADVGAIVINNNNLYIYF